MKLSQILSQVNTVHDLRLLSNSDSIDVEDIAIDSRLVKKNSVFFALAGKTNNGTQFIEDAIKNGASIVVVEKGKLTSSQFNFIEVANISALLTEFLQIFYKPLPANIYAVTGTNGKTSVAEFTRQILQFLGKKSASIGTLGVNCDEQIKPYLENSSLTTPDIISLYKNLKILKQNNVDDVAIEVSSIGLEQGRIAGLNIDVGAFTNFTQDHLDYHKNMEEYFNCKMILFSSVLGANGVAVLNSDIAEFGKIKQICEDRKIKIIEYGFGARDLKIESIDNQQILLEFCNKKYHFKFSASGDFQAFNIVCALGNILAKYKISHEHLVQLLEKFSTLVSAAGRMQRVGILKNHAQIFIDFAHSPDALENILLLARKIAKARVVILFGCGGNRDAKKRPIMGEIATKLADLVIVTDDNPRLEDSASIRKQIMASCNSTKAIEIADRKLAIEKAIKLLQADDILILAGKGHEKYQIIGDKKFEFDEEKIVKNVITAAS